MGFKGRHEQILEKSQDGEQGAANCFCQKSDSCTVLMLHHLAHKHTRSVKSMFPGVALYSATPPCSNIPHVGT